MRNIHRDWRRNVVWTVWACAACFAAAGCGESVVNSGVVHSGTAPANSLSSAANVPTAGANDADATPVEAAPEGDSAVPAEGNGTSASAVDDPARPRSFAVEGPDGALRIGFDDLDLFRLLKMDPVTPDCVEKMPEWLKELGGKKVRIRGFMKPSGLSDGIPQFLLVRSTDMCCFGPKGKVYHMVATTLKPGTTTEYIVLTPFDVVGTFKIDMLQLDDGSIFLLYHIDDAAIIRK